MREGCRGEWRGNGPRFSSRKEAKEGLRKSSGEVGGKAFFKGEEGTTKLKRMEEANNKKGSTKASGIMRTESSTAAISGSEEGPKEN